jgi:hypothetical protein
VFRIASEEVGCYGGHGGRDAVDRDEEVLGASRRSVIHDSVEMASSSHLTINTRKDLGNQPLLPCPVLSCIAAQDDKATNLTCPKSIPTFPFPSLP